MLRFRSRVLRFRVLGASFSRFRGLRFRVLGASFSRFKGLRFRSRVLRFRSKVLRFRDLGASFSSFGCFLLRSSFSSASFSKLPLLLFPCSILVKDKTCLIIKEM